MTMFNKYYQQELQNLRELAREFSEVHPATAPMLSGPTSDPDVERLLEGVAFLTGLLNRKLDNDFPEFIHGLTDVIFPHYLRPVPATSIVTFTPKPSLQETLIIPAGTSLASIPVEGTRCIFRTCFDMEVHPLRILSAGLTENQNNSYDIHVHFELLKSDVSNWHPSRVGFLLGDNYVHAANMYMLLTHYLESIHINPGTESDGNVCVLPPSNLVQTGFQPGNSLLPYPHRSFPGYRLLQEYFVLPQKFLFLELRGWENWKDRGTGNRFEITFRTRPSPLPKPSPKAEHFILSATPVINLFTETVEKVVHDFRVEKVRIRPSTIQKDHYQVFSVDKVTGFKQGSATEKEYIPLDMFPAELSQRIAYQVIRSRSAVDDSIEHYLSFAYPPGGPEPVQETLSLKLTLTNGFLPERLKIGDICEQTSDSPGLVDFRNIMPPTLPVDPPLDKNTLWKLISHLSLNLSRYANADTIKNILNLYVLPEGKNKAQISANKKRVDGIQDFSVMPVDRMVNALIMRGQKIQATMRQDHFAGPGDLHVFASVLNVFMGMYSSMNTFTQFELKDSISGETFLWPCRLGNKPLI